MRKKLAIITGSTCGLGLSFAELLAKNGWNLFITGRRSKILYPIKYRLEQDENVSVTICITDFNIKKQLDYFLDQVGKLDHVDMLVNNAGYGHRSDFFKDDFTNQYSMLNVHVNATTKLIHTVVPKMINENSGTIINVASLSAFIPTPLSIFYSATKAFIVSFTECLHVELLDTNIKVQVLCPGYIKTQFHSRMKVKTKQNKSISKWLWMNPNDVVEYSIKSINKRKVICIPGNINKIGLKLMKWIPKSIFYQVLSKRTYKYHKYNMN